VSIHHLRNNPAAPLRQACEAKITLVLYPVDVARETTTALQDTYANDELLLKIASNIFPVFRARENSITVLFRENSGKTLELLAVFPSLCAPSAVLSHKLRCRNY
jgi:hypothetical protein